MNDLGLPATRHDGGFLSFAILKAPFPFRLGAFYVLNAVFPSEVVAAMARQTCPALQRVMVSRATQVQNSWQ